MTRSNGSAADHYEQRCHAEAELAEEHSGLAWLVRRMRATRIAILRLLAGGGRLNLELELELQRLEQEFRRQMDDDDEC